MSSQIHKPMSGQAFVELIHAELRSRKTHLGQLTPSRLGISAGLSSKYVANLISEPRPNPSSLSMRLILYVLGYSIPNPEHDVIPHRESKGLPMVEPSTGRPEASSPEGKQ